MRYRATVAYVGTFFHGWQVQENAARTVQAVLEEMIARFAGTTVRLHASGRTDAGVHADGQIVHFDAPELAPEGLRKFVNTHLPWDVRVLDVGPARDHFHARADATAKRYVYRFSRGSVIPPSRALFVAPLSAGADPARMADAACRLEGTRDFFPFSTSGTETETTIRSLFSCSVEESGAEIDVRMTASGFLRGMARAIAGTLADIGRGRRDASVVEEIFARRDRALVSSKAKPRGLTLEKVFYGNERLARPVWGPAAGH